MSLIAATAPHHYDQHCERYGDGPYVLRQFHSWELSFIVDELINSAKIIITLSGNLVNQTHTAGAAGDFGASKQWAGRVFSVICQVHTNVFVSAKTGPISDATVVVPEVLCLGGPYTRLYGSRLAQSGPAGVLFQFPKHFQFSVILQG